MYVKDKDKKRSNGDGAVGPVVTIVRFMRCAVPKTEAECFQFQKIKFQNFHSSLFLVDHHSHPPSR